MISTLTPAANFVNELGVNGIGFYASEIFVYTGKFDHSAHDYNDNRNK